MKLGTRGPIRVHLTVAAALAAALLVPVEQAHAADGDLDTGFGIGGLATTHLSGNDEGRAVALDGDGKIVVVGRSGPIDNHDFGIARYNSDGTLDTTFSDDGWTVTGFPNDGDALAVAIQDDGRIVVGGFTFGTSDFVLVRYLSDGTPDTSFDGDGIVTTDFGGFDDRIDALLIQPDGKILAAGRMGTFAGLNFGLARYNPDGSLDNTFDDDGKQFVDFGASAEDASAVALQADGRIIVAGYGGDGVALARLQEGGALDTSFSGDGRVVTIMGVSRAHDVILDSAGRAVVAGYACDTECTFALARYNVDGTPDETFGASGTQALDIAPGEDKANAIEVQPNGNILVAGLVQNQKWGVARLLPSGALDTTFGSGGSSIVATGIDGIFDVELQDDGKLVAVGKQFVGSGYDFLVGRFLNDDGAVPPPPPRITFVSTRDGDSEIFSMAADGTDVTQTTSNSVEDIHPRWSSTGDLAFARHAPASTDLDIYSMEADGTGEDQLTSDPGTDTEPTWSPDGTHLAWASDRDGDFDIYTMYADGTHIRRITNNTTADREPVWSPDGTRIAWRATGTSGSGDIYVMDPDGTDIVDMTSAPDDEVQPDWSPDGTRIMYTTNGDHPSGEVWHIYSMDSVTGGSVVQLTDDLVDDSQPVWSPNGAQVAFNSNRDGPSTQYEIYVMDSDGSDQTRLTVDGALDVTPTWAPAALGPPDGDDDAVADVDDVCPTQFGLDGVGCPDPSTADTDSDEISDEDDNCPTIANNGQQDADEDGTGDVCDLERDLTIVKSAQAKGVRAGYDITFTITVTNNDPLPATDVEVEDIVPAGVVIASAGPGCAVDGQEVTCDLGTLDGDETVIIQLVVTPTITGALANTASVEGADPDPDDTDNESTRTVTVTGTSCTIVGTQGVDALPGTSGADVICGLGGSDTISAGADNDLLIGGSGDDLLKGEAGTDTLRGGTQIDRCDGGGPTAASDTYIECEMLKKYPPA